MSRSFLSALLLAVALVAGVLSISSPSSAAFDLDCSDFDTQRQAQTFFENHNPSLDPHRLDGSDNDGRACESLPCPCGSTGSGQTGTAKPKPKVIRQLGRITKVVDGDTVKVRLGSGARRTVRLIGINTPEVYGGVQCGGPRASRSLKQLLPVGTRVRLRSDPTQARRDRYGRDLRYVVKASTGKDMNRVQVYRGWARVFVYDNKPFQLTRSYRYALGSAKRGRRGIWGRC